MNLQNVLSVATILINLSIYFRVLQIRTKSRAIIPYGNTRYHFKIIYGPAVEDIFEKSVGINWDKSLGGFELIAPNEPWRDAKYYCNKDDPERRVISFLIFPDWICEYRDAKTNDNLHPMVREENSINKTVERFLSQQAKELKMTAFIRKEARGYMESYFGGGGPAYGTQYRLDIVYNPDTRKGSIVIEEE